MSPGYYDRDGRPIDMYQWMFRHNDFDYMVVAKEQIGDHLVSTVWLGLDHNFTGDGPPLIFETMVFPESDVCLRTSTEAAALATHDQVCAQLRDERRSG